MSFGYSVYRPENGQPFSRKKHGIPHAKTAIGRLNKHPLSIEYDLVRDRGHKFKMMRKEAACCATIPISPHWTEKFRAKMMSM